VPKKKPKFELRDRFFSLKHDASINAMKYVFT